MFGWAYRLLGEHFRRRCQQCKVKVKLALQVGGVENNKNGNNNAIATAHLASPRPVCVQQHLRPRYLPADPCRSPSQRCFILPSPPTRRKLNAHPPIS